MLSAELDSDFCGELVVGEGLFREPPTVMQPNVSIAHQVATPPCLTGRYHLGITQDHPGSRDPHPTPEGG